MPPGSGPVSLIRGREPAEQQHRARSAHHHWQGGRLGRLPLPGMPQRQKDSEA